MAARARMLLWMSLSTVAVAAGGIVPAAAAATAADAGDTSRVRTLAAWGGALDIEWNHALLADLGLSLSPPRQSLGVRHNHQRFAIDRSTVLRFTVDAGEFAGFTGGSLRVRGGYLLRAGDGSSIALHDMALRARPGDARVLDVVGADGTAWFFVDRLMYGLDAPGQLEIRAMDLRIGAALARRIGRPAAAGMVVAGMELAAELQYDGDATMLAKGGACPSSSRWPGMPAPGGGTFQVDVFMQSLAVQYTRSAGADGPGGSDGRVVFTPTASLRNNVNDGTAVQTIADPLGTSNALHAADVPWHEKFTGSCPPYGNDQHPYLVWNLYRIDAHGQLEQVARSGLKHALFTINSGCAPGANPFNGHVLGRGCGDTYGVANNDSADDLGPRSEVIPSTGLWGRCGSVYDPDCNGSPDDFAGYDAFAYRLAARESEIDPAANPGAQWLFEAWYLVRDDIDVLNTMQTRELSFSWQQGLWTVQNGGNLRLGPAIDRWVDPAAPGADASSTLLATALGQARIAVRTQALADGWWRYDIAVMNLDFSVASTSGSGDSLRVLDNRGFTGLDLPLPQGTLVRAASVADGDDDPANDWQASLQGDSLQWIAPGTAELGWGTLQRFSFEADAAPGPGQLALHSDAGSHPAAARLPLQGDPGRIFRSGFESP